MAKRFHLNVINPLFPAAACVFFFCFFLVHFVLFSLLLSHFSIQSPNLFFFSHIQSLLCISFYFSYIDFVSAPPLSFVFPIHFQSGAQHWFSRCSSPSSRPSSRYQSGPNASLPTRPPSRPPSRPSRPPSHPSAHGSPAPLSTLPKRLSLEGTRHTWSGPLFLFFFCFGMECAAVHFCALTSMNLFGCYFLSACVCFLHLTLPLVYFIQYLLFS